MFRFSASAAAVLLNFSAVLAGQTSPPSPVRESAEAVLVEVPVRVVDREGKPIRGLTAKDFDLFDDGRRQEIVACDAIDLAHKRSGTDEPESLHPAARRHFLILFDLTFARPKAVLAARKAAKEFVLSGMDDRDFAAVATFSVEKGVRLLVTFSADRVQLARAIDTLGISAASTLASDPLQFMYDVMNTMGGSASGVERSGGQSEAQAAGMLETLQTLASLERARLDQHARSQVVRLTQALGGLARALDTVEGRKDVIYLSEGFENRLLSGAKGTDQEREWTLTGESWKVDVEKTFGNSNLQSQVREMSDLFRRSDCVIHAVDIGGLRAEADVGFSPVRGENALFEIANGTGGEVLRNDNDFHAQLSRLVARTSLVYVLAFRPTRSGQGDRFHELKVKVRASGGRLSARPGYYERKAFRALTPLERSLSAADVIANEIPLSDIPLRLLASPVPGPKGFAAVPVLVEVPGDRFLIQQNGLRASAEIYVYAHDFQNQLRDFFTQTISVDLTRNRTRLAGGTLKYFGQLSLPPGQYRLRALVRNGETGRMGLVAQSLRVPDFSENKPYLAAPMFLESSADGIFVRGPSRVPGVDVPAGDELLVAAQRDDLVPAALPQVRSGTASRVSVVAYHFAASPGDSLRIGAQVLSEEGRPLQEGSIAVLGKAPADARGRQSLLVAFTPEGLAPGRYSLRLILQDSATGEGGHASTPFMVR
ncbi:MAG: VWA domain-containing protein [Acidobacteria bacterium]|nr:VWA domain-containing protein [Acidobacteriota bacterium]MCA1611002.1 VWA domain-containing protein [Acidobacteriota bacterium]